MGSRCLTRKNRKARITKGVTTLIVLIVVGFRLTSARPYDAGAVQNIERRRRRHGPIEARGGVSLIELEGGQGKKAVG